MSGDCDHGRSCCPEKLDECQGKPHALPPAEAPGYILTQNDTYPPLPAVPRLEREEEPCWPCQPPSGYLPPGIAPAQVPGESSQPEIYPEAGDGRPYVPYKLPLPINDYNPRFVCQPPTAPETKPLVCNPCGQLELDPCACQDVLQPPGPDYVYPPQGDPQAYMPPQAPPPYLSQPGDGVAPQVDRGAWRSEADWRRHNQELLLAAANAIHKTSLLGFNARRCMEHTAAATDYAQRVSQERLRVRAHEIHGWKTDLERGLFSFTQELAGLEATRLRLKAALSVLRKPADITAECLTRRAARPGAELVVDVADVELQKELALLNDWDQKLGNLTSDLDKQILSVKAIKSKMEMDWSDKKESHEIDSTNIGLKNCTPTNMFYPGSVRIPEKQSDYAKWASVTKENMSMMEAERLHIVDLRNTIDKLLTDASREVRRQADRSDEALALRVAETEEAKTRLTADLQLVLQKIADTEQLLADLRRAIRGMDLATKLVQTRLHNRLSRPNVENCRDLVQDGLLKEESTAQMNVAALLEELKCQESTLQALICKRAELENDIENKQRTLSIDRDRCQMLRAAYPSTVAMSGY